MGLRVFPRIQIPSNLRLRPVRATFHVSLSAWKPRCIQGASAKMPTFRLPFLEDPLESDLTLNRLDIAAVFSSPLSIQLVDAFQVHAVTLLSFQFQWTDFSNSAQDYILSHNDQPSSISLRNSFLLNNHTLPALFGVGPLCNPFCFPDVHFKIKKSG